MTSPDIGSLEVEIRANFDRLVRDIEARLQAINRSQAIRLRVKLQDKTLETLNKNLKSYTGFNALTNEFQRGGEAIRGVFDNIGKFSRRLVLLGGILGPLTVGIGALSIAIVALGTAAAGALLAVPGLFLGAAASVFVFKTAMEDASTVLESSLKPYGEIKKIISENFWAKAEGGARLLLDSAVKPLTEGFGVLATAAGDFTSHFAASLSRAFTPDVYKTFFGGLTEAFNILGHGFSDAFASIAKQLVVFSAELFPRIAQGLENITIKFDNFLKANPTFLIDSFNTFVDVLKGIIATAVGLFGIFQAIATAATAAGIGAGSFGESLKGVADRMKAPEFQKGLTAFFVDAKAGMAGLAPAFDSFGTLLGSLAPIIGKFIADSGAALGDFFGKLFTAMNKPEVIANISKAFEVLPKIFENLSPVVGNLAEDFGELLAFGATLADEFSKNLAAAIEALSPVMAAILPSVEKLTKALGEFFRTKIKDLAPQFESVGKAIGGLIEGVTAFVEALDTPVLKFIMSLIIDFIATAVKGVLNLVSGILKVVAGLAKVLSGDFSGFAQIFDGLKSAITGAFQLLITVFAPAKIIGRIIPQLRLVGIAIGGWVIQAIVFIARQLDRIPGLGVRALQALLGRVAGAAGAIGGAIVNGIIRGAQALIGGFLVQFFDWIVGGVKSILGISSPSTVFAEIGGFLIQGLIAGIQALIGGVAALFSGPIDAIKALFEGAFALILIAAQFLWEGIKVSFDIFSAAISAGIAMVQAVVSAVWVALQAAGSVVWTVISASFKGWKIIISAGIEVVKAIVSAVWTALKTAGSLLWTVLTTVFNTWKGIISAGIAVVKAVVNAVWDALKVAGSLLWTVLSASFNGWKSIISAGIAVVRAVVNAVWTALKTAGSLVWTVITAAFNAWRSAISAGIAAVRAVITAVWDVIKAAGSAVWTVVTAAFNRAKATISAGIAAVRAVVNGVWEGIKSAGSAAWSAVSGAFNTMKGAISGGIAALLGAVNGAWNGIKGAGAAAWTAISGAFNAMKGAISGGISALQGAVNGAWNSIKSAGSSIWSGITGAFNGMKGALVGGVGAITSAFTGAFESIRSKVAAVFSFIRNSIPKISIPGLSRLPGFATGVRNFGGGIALVGERGPELVRLPKGSDVFTNGESRSMLLRSAALNVPVPIAPTAPATADPGRWDDVIAELRALRGEVASTNNKYLVLARQGAI